MTCDPGKVTASVPRAARTIAGAVREWWDFSRLVDIACDSRGRWPRRYSRTPSTEQHRREEMLLTASFPARLMVNQQDGEWAPQDGPMPFNPVRASRIWLDVTARRIGSEVRIVSADERRQFDRTLDVTSARYWGEGPNMFGPTLTIKLTRDQGPDVQLAVGRRQADRILALLNEQGQRTT